MPRQDCIEIAGLRRGSHFVKCYHYPYASDVIVAQERLSAWAAFSQECMLVPRLEVEKIELSSTGLNVEVSQLFCRRLPHQTGDSVRPYLEELQLALKQAWSIGLVHGDLNRKNIWLTAKGYRLVDIEPLLCIPLASGGIYLRTTLPYLAESDRVLNRVTVASDHLGWNCYSAWIHGLVHRPALAASILPLYSMICHE